MIYGIIIALITLIAILLAISILLQSGQGEGLAGGMAATGMPGQLMGARRTADVLSKTTSVLGGLFLVLCVVANFFIDRNQPTESVIQKGVAAPIETPISEPVAPAVPAPAETPATGN